jgi:hypothetical protein
MFTMIFVLLLAPLILIEEIVMLPFNIIEKLIENRFRKKKKTSNY